MRGMIDLCGTPVDVQRIREFRLVNIDYVYRPVYGYEPVRLFGTPLFSRLCLREMEPYGAVIRPYDAFPVGTYFPVSSRPRPEGFGGVLNSIGEMVSGLFGQEAMREKPLVIRRHSGAAEQRFLRDVPARVCLRDGTQAEESVRGERLRNLRHGALPAVREIPALLVLTDRPLVIFGSGIDIDDVRVPYELLLRMRSGE